MKLIIVVINILSCMFFSCGHKPPLTAREAWKNHNREYFNHYLDSIQREPIDSFIYSLNYAFDASGFQYGLLDPEHNWETVNTDSLKGQIVRVQKMFYKRCDFGVEETVYAKRLQFLQDKYFKWYSLSEPEYVKLEAEMDSVCKILSKENLSIPHKKR